MTMLEHMKKSGVYIHRNGKGEEYVSGCPYEHGLETKEESEKFCEYGAGCVACYEREMKALTGEQREFSTGAVRDSAAGKGRYDLLPWNAIHALAQHCERGAEHYGEHNVDKGIPQKSLIDSACRHLRGYITGDAEDYHLVAAMWNIAWAVEQEMMRPEMVDIYGRGDGAGKPV